MIQINSYFSKQYDAHIKLMRLITIIGLCMLATLILNYFEPLKAASAPLFNIVLVVGMVLVIKVGIDMYSRKNDEYDEYSWATAPTTQNDVDVANTKPASMIDISGVDVPFCYGSACCNTGTIWDENSYSCVIDTTAR